LKNFLIHKIIFVLYVMKKVLKCTKMFGQKLTSIIVMILVKYAVLYVITVIVG